MNFEQASSREKGERIEFKSKTIEKISVTAIVSKSLPSESTAKERERINTYYTGLEPYIQSLFKAHKSSMPLIN
jgi:hypothetical protein